MKCLTVFSALIITASAHAATLSLRWADNPGADKIALPASGTSLIDVVLELSAGDNVSGLFFVLESAPFIHLETFTSLPDWEVGGFVGLTFSTAQFAVGSSVPNSSVDISGPGTFVVGSFSFLFDPSPLTPIGRRFEIAFNANEQNQIVASDGSFLTLTANESFAAYSGYWTYGQGSPGITQMANSIPRRPLFVTLVPEPASILLLSLSGAALVLRRASR